MAHQKLIIPPGVNRDATQYLLENGGWYDTHNVRFRAGMPEKIGGWKEYIPQKMVGGPPRTMHVWRDLAGAVLVAIATGTHVYVIKNKVLTDITPSTAAFAPDADTLWSFDNWGEDLVMCPWGGPVYVWKAAGAANKATRVIAAPSKVQFLLVTDNRHLACFGCNYDPVSAAYVASDPNVDGDVLDTMRVQWCGQEDLDFWDIGDKLKTAGDYRFTGGSHLVAAAKVDTIIMVWTEESAHLMQLVDPPFIFRFDQIGTSTGIIAPKAWAVHNGILMWMGDAAFYKYAGGVAPVECPLEEYLFRRLNYSQRRKIFAALDRRNDEFLWFYPLEGTADTLVLHPVAAGDTTIDVVSTAGFDVAGEVVIEHRHDSSRVMPEVNQQRATAFSTDGHTFKYTGVTEGSFTGVTKTDGSPIDIVFAPGDTVTGEIKTNVEPSRYIAFGLKENAWWLGRMNRTAWVDRGMIEYPLATRSDGRVFEHDYGTDASDKPLVSYLESCEFDLAEGDELMFVRRFVPDFDMRGGLQVALRTRYFPQSEVVHEFVGDVAPNTEYIDVRIRGRQMSFVVTSEHLGDDWRLGACRVDLQPDGRKN